MTARGLVEQLRAARVERGIHQRQVASMLGVALSAVGVWETHHYYPRVDVARAWCELLDVPVPAGVEEWFRPPLDACGTRTSYDRHRARGEDCPTCRAVNTAYARRYRQARAEPRTVVPLPILPDRRSRGPARSAFVKKMRAKRVAAGLAQADIARRLGVAANTVSKWERAQLWPRSAQAAEWARLLDVRVVGGSLDEIFRPARSPCGTPNGYRQHRGLGEERCNPCWAAWSVYVGWLKKRAA